MKSDKAYLAQLGAVRFLLAWGVLFQVCEKQALGGEVFHTPAMASKNETVGSTDAQVRMEKSECVLPAHMLSSEPSCGDDRV